MALFNENARAASKRLFRLSFVFAAWSLIQLNTFSESIGQPQPAGANQDDLSSEKLKRFSRSRNFRQSTQGLSIQDEGGCFAPGSGDPVQGSSLWRTCRWGGYK